MKLHLLLILFLTIIAACNKPEPGVEYFSIRNDNTILPVEVSGNISSNIFIIYLANYEFDNWELRRLEKQIFNELSNLYALVEFNYNRCAGLGETCEKAGYQLSDIVSDIDFLTNVMKNRYGEETSLFLFGRGFAASVALHYADEGQQKNRINGVIANLPFLNFVETAIASKDRFVEIIEQKLEPDKATIQTDTLNKIIINDFETAEFYYNFFLRNYFIEGLDEFHESNLFPDCENSLNETVGLLYTNRDEFYHRYIYYELERFRLNFIELNISENVSRINLPVSLVWQKDALIVPVSIGEEIFNLLETPDKKLQVFEDPCIPYFDEGGAYTQEIVEFIEKYK